MSVYKDAGRGPDCGRKGLKSAGRALLVAWSVGAIVFVVGSAHAYGTPLQTQGTPEAIAPEVVKSYAKGLEVNAETGRRNLERQQAGAGIGPALEQSEGSSFAGLWFDNQTGEFVVPVLARGNIHSVNRAIQSAHLSQYTRTDAATYSWDELAAAQEGVDASLRPLFEDGLVRTSLNPRTNAVDIDVAADADAQQHRQVRKIADATETNAEVTISDEPTLGLENLSCATETKICSKPLRGGVAISPNVFREYGCTGAFKAIGKQFGNRFLLTAGHCEGTHFWTEGPVTEIHEIGKVEGKVYPGGDWQAINATKSYWDVTPWPSLVAFWDHGAEAQELAIQAEGSSYVGEYVCHSGLTTGGTCGYVTDMNATAQVSGGRLEYHLTLAGSACAKEGDSGGPVFAGNVALGIVSAGAGACGEAVMAYVEITEADDLLL